MKKRHIPSLKFHTLYTIGLSVIFLGIILLAPEITLFAAVVFLLLYVGGNGIIHSKKNELSRDSLVEYIIVSLVALVVLLGVVL